MTLNPTHYSSKRQEISCVFGTTSILNREGTEALSENVDVKHLHCNPLGAILPSMYVCSSTCFCQAEIVIVFENTMERIQTEKSFLSVLPVLHGSAGPLWLGLWLDSVGLQASQNPSNQNAEGITPSKILLFNALYEGMKTFSIEYISCMCTTIKAFVEINYNITL